MVRLGYGPPVSGRVRFPGIITIWGGGIILAVNWKWGTAFPYILLHFNHCENWIFIICGSVSEMTLAYALSHSLFTEHLWNPYKTQPLNIS